MKKAKLIRLHGNNLIKLQEIAKNNNITDSEVVNRLIERVKKEINLFK